MAKKQFAVIGVGRFGSSVARKLVEAGQDVLVIDSSEERIQDVEHEFTHAVVADATDEKALTSVDILSFDSVIVAISSDMQSSILTTMLLSNLGVEKIIAKAIDERHGQVLEKIGVDWIIYPEKDMGERVANQILSPNVLNYIEISKRHSIEEVKLPKSMVGKSLKELDLRTNYNINVIALERGGDVIVSMNPDEALQKDDLLIIIGKRKDLAGFSGE